MQWLILFISIQLAPLNQGHAEVDPAGTEMEGMDWFYAQRAYPLGYIPAEAVARARRQARELAADYDVDFGEWQFVGPSNIGGRITAIAGVHWGRIFVGTANGGVFTRQYNLPGNWTPIFDGDHSLSIGALAVDEQNGYIYVGTGETNTSGDSFDGDGLYVSRDTGATWIHLGLDSTDRIARIVINPQNPNEIFVAAMGHLYRTDTTRGVYRSTDGGETWEKVLFINDTTGCIDLAINPQNPNIIYAAMWSRIRGPEARIISGSGNGIYKSTDGGTTWQRLTNGLPSSNVGRIGIAISESNPDVLYAVFTDNIGHFNGLYKTTDGGDSWTRTNDGAIGGIFSSYGWYLGRVVVSPDDPSTVYVLGVEIYRSSDGGNTWQWISWNVHADHHALWIMEENPQVLIDGNDGGVYVTYNGGTSWERLSGLPITQFYNVAVDPNSSVRLYGGSQDNGTMRGTTNAPNAWSVILWGDGMLPMVHPSNPNIVFAEWQFGNLNKSTDMGNSFYMCIDGINPNDRRNWDTPYAMTPSNPDVMYYGTYRVYKSTNLADYWVPVSPDLTNGPGSGNLVYGTLSAIKVSPVNPNFVLVGTDDGNVWVSRDAGSTWTNVSADLPDRYVTDIAAHPVDLMTFFVTFSGYSLGEQVPYIFVTHDLGETWQDVTYNLPQAPVNAVEIDPEDPDYIYVGTDVGAYYITMNDTLWRPLGHGLPNSVIMDLALNNPYRFLVAATHGRSMYMLDLPDFSVSEEPVNDGVKAVHAVLDGNKIVISFAVNGEIWPEVKLLSSSGRVVREVKSGPLKRGSRLELPVNGLPGGVYFVRIRAEREMWTQKVVILSTR